MMRLSAHGRRILALVGTIMLVPIASLEAQRPLFVGVGGGVSLPTGDLNDAVDPGWNALATIGLSTYMQPLGLRLDVAYNRFAFAGTGGDQSTGSATLNVTYRMPMTNSPLSPYLVSGLGAYRSECSNGPACDATTRYGWNVGLGTKLYFLGFRSFLEARYHRTEAGETHIQYFPVTFGIVF